jgi:hypothetical protein
MFEDFPETFEEFVETFEDFLEVFEEFPQTFEDFLQNSELQNYPLKGVSHGKDYRERKSGFRYGRPGACHQQPRHEDCRRRGYGNDGQVHRHRKNYCHAVRNGAAAPVQRGGA